MILLYEIHKVFVVLFLGISKKMIPELSEPWGNPLTHFTVFQGVSKLTMMGAQSALSTKELFYGHGSIQQKLRFCYVWFGPKFLNFGLHELVNMPTLLWKNIIYQYQNTHFLLVIYIYLFTCTTFWHNSHKNLLCKLNSRWLPTNTKSNQHCLSEIPQTNDGANTFNFITLTAVGTQYSDHQ